MRIATFNVNGVNGRLPRLIEWLHETMPDVVCLQEIKTGDATFPAKALDAAGYCAAWHGQRYIEAKVRGLTVASIYLPSGNPQPGPKFDYKLAWFDRLILHASTLMASGQDVVLAGDFNVVPTNGEQTRFAATRASEWTSCF